MTSKVKKIINTVAKEWIVDNVPYDKEGIDWALDEALFDAEIDLNRQERKEADKELYVLIKKLSASKKQEESVLKEEETDSPTDVVDPTETSLWGKEGEETLEFVVDVDKINKTIDDLNNQYGEEFTIEVIEKGMGVEKEHSSDEDIQFAIALDHLGEDPYYYDKLLDMEQQSEENADNPEDFDSEIDMDVEEEPEEDILFDVEDSEEDEDTEEDEDSEKQEDEDEDEEKK